MINDGKNNMNDFVKDQVSHWEGWIKNNPNSKIKADVLSGLSKLRGMM